jgi:hypothetical protein
MSKYASKVVEQAKSWIGCNEADGSHKQIIDVYNSHKPWARGVKMEYDWEWCACFVSSVAIKLGYTDIIPTEISCSEMVELLKGIGAWVENDAHVPAPGTIIFYDWQDKTGSKADNTGSPDHVGIVEKVVGDTIHVIEGNHKNGVNIRPLRVNGDNIRGFGVPKYDAEPAEKPTTKTEVCSVEVKELKKGAKGDSVKAMQLLLIGYGYKLPIYGADSDFGSETEKAVRAFQKDKGLSVDAICGPNTWEKLLGV